MPKINQEEYEILQFLNNTKDWIVRNPDGQLWAVEGEKPRKSPFYETWKEGDGQDTSKVDVSSFLFQFIQWEDEEPYLIAELIEEYEEDYKGSWEHAIEFSREVFGESKETEAKKDKQWLINKVRKACDYEDDNRLNIKSYKMVDLINQLDEPETLSQEWLVEHSYNVHLLGTPDVETVAVPRDNLEGILVPKQEVLTDEQIARKVDQAYKDGYEKGKQHTFYKGYLEGLGDKGSEPETVADVVTTFWESYERLKEVMSMEVEELEE